MEEVYARLIHLASNGKVIKVGTEMFPNLGSRWKGHKELIYVEGVGMADMVFRCIQEMDIDNRVMDSHNQAGIAYNGGIEPLLKLLGTKSAYSVQHNASFALYALVDNEDNVAVIIKAGCFQKLPQGHFNAQVRYLLSSTSLRYLYLMRTGEKGVQIPVVLALAHLCSPDDPGFGKIMFFIA
ncbi:Actin-related protein 2 [Trifolium repens]|nr:Actin-related protein 2 [Trifolium repens]